MNLLLLLVKINCESDVLTFSKMLYIPGRYYSLINTTYDITKLDDYFNVDIEFQLSQVSHLPIKTAYHNQGNSIYDLIMMKQSEYNTIIPCYKEAISYLDSLYNSF